jgi:osmotically-inducible protein OsmY
MVVISMRLITILLAVLALPGCTAMLLGNNSSGEAAPATSRTATQSSADSTISGSIRQQYVADGEISRYTLGIRTTAGRVTLSGTVGSYDIRDRVVDIAQNTHGVVSVDSRVTVNTNL